MLCQECSVVSTIAVAADNDVFPSHVAANGVVISSSAGGSVGAQPCIPTKTVQSAADPADDGIWAAEAMTSSTLTACQHISTVAGPHFQEVRAHRPAVGGPVVMPHISTSAHQYIRTAARQHGSARQRTAAR